MRELIFQTILTLLNTLSKFKSTDGTNRVYDYPASAYSGYPACILSSVGMESEVHDSQRDMRKYSYEIYVIGEKFGEQGGLTQSQALSAMRATEDQLVTLFDSKNRLGIPSVTRTMPLSSVYGFTDGGSRVILTLAIRVDFPTTIVYE